MKKYLELLGIAIGLLAISIEFIFDCHIILKIIGAVLGTMLVIECLLAFTGKVNGIVLRWKSFWVGLHYSDKNRRYCLNLLPGITIWWVKDGGKTPEDII